jgi:hypothetical protein
MGTGHRVVKFVSGMRTLILRKLKTRKYDVRVNVVQRDTDGGRYIVTVERGNTGGLHSAQAFRQGLVSRDKIYRNPTTGKTILMPY